VIQDDAPVILVVDDEIDLCKNLADILGDLGCRVDLAHDGASALKLASQTAYDVALLDLRMPGMSGLELCRELKSLRAGTVSIIVTAFASRATAEEAIDAGAWKVLTKPVELPALLRLVEEAVGLPLVLVVDDDRELCESLRDVLHDRGYRVAMAHDASEAESRLAEREYRVVLIDMRLPTGTGEEVFQMVQATNRSARTVLVTAHHSGSRAMVDRILRSGADAVCYKPFNLPELLGEVRRLTQTQRDQGAET
jgi:DNA-binding NtrC family response regulator